MALAGLNPAGIFSYGEVVGNLKGQLSTLQTQVNVLSGFGNLIQGLANFDEQLQARIPSWRETSMTSPEPKPPKIVPRVDRRDVPESGSFFLGVCPAMIPHESPGEWSLCTQPMECRVNGRAASAIAVGVDPAKSLFFSRLVRHQLPHRKKKWLLGEPLPGSQGLDFQKSSHSWLTVRRLRSRKIAAIEYVFDSLVEMFILELSTRGRNGMKLPSRRCSAPVTPNAPRNWSRSGPPTCEEVILESPTPHTTRTWSPPNGCCLLYPCSTSTWDSLVRRDRLFHCSELPNRGRRIHVWLSAVPMSAAADRIAAPFIDKLRSALSIR